MPSVSDAYASCNQAGGSRLASPLQVTSGVPSVLARMDGHMVLANSDALRLAGISFATADPEDGTIDRDGLGQPTGILRWAASPPLHC